MLLLDDLRRYPTKHNKTNLLMNADDIDLAVFSYALDPYKVYHMKNFEVIELIEGEPSMSMFDLLDDILYGHISGGKAKDAVNKFAANHGSLIKVICSKNLRCGVNAKTVNSVWPKMIPVFNVQLAKEVPINQVSFPCLVQIKYDGVRLIAIKRNEEVVIKTRNGKKVNLPNFKKLIRKIEGDFILDGEIVVASGKSEDRTKVSGMINSAMHGGAINEYDLVFNVFDAMTTIDWDAGKCDVVYAHRLKMVRLLVDKIDSCLVDVAFTFNAKSKEVLEEHYTSFIGMGYEGLVLKKENHKYTFKRSKDWIKLKEIKTVELICTGVNYGAAGSKYEDQIGALCCEGEVEGKNIIVNVGSGLTDNDRYLPASAFTSKQIEIKYNSVILDTTTGRWSLFLPRFMYVRYDK